MDRSTSIFTHPESFPKLSGKVAMEPKLYLSFSDLFNREPMMDELVHLLQGIPLRHAIYSVTFINHCLRVAMQDSTQDFLKLQEKLLAAHLDNEWLAAAKRRFPKVRCDERPVFFPECVLNVMRLVVLHGDPDPFPIVEQDEQIRYLIGRACLIVNSLLVSKSQADALKAGTKDDQRLELMTQWLSGFELANPPKATHLMPRLEIMYRILLTDPEIRESITARAGGFDLESQFNERLGVTLEHWLFIVFAIYAYFLNIGSVLDPDPSYMILNPSIFRGESGISQEELHKVISIISKPVSVLQTKLAALTRTDARYDFVEFRSSPLIELEPEKLVPADLTFLLEKCHTGVQWALHDALPTKELRQSLFNAWGALFEEYVHWLLKGAATAQANIYFPSPKWKESGNESFDGIVLNGDVMLAAEYKGGFILREARYSGDSATFTKELDKKMSYGCRQLATKIGTAFAGSVEERKELVDLCCSSIRAVIPVLVVQDHILRVPFANWYLNVQFQTFLREQRLRSDVAIRPLTVLTIHELESIIHAVEGTQFDFVYALHNRSRRDPEVLSNVGEWLSQFPEFGRSRSPRLAKILKQIVERISFFLFPDSDEIPAPIFSQHNDFDG